MMKLSIPIAIYSRIRCATVSGSPTSAVPAPPRTKPTPAQRLGLTSNLSRRPPCRAAMRLWPASDEKISFEYKVKRFLEGCLMPADRAHVHWNGTFSDAQKNSLLCSAPQGALDRTLQKLREVSLGRDDLTPYLWFDQKYFLPDDILTKVDRMSMAHAVEVRPPFLDHRIVEFAASLDPSLKIRGSSQKFVLKELMRGKLPSTVLRRKKIGFDIPAHEWLRGPMRPWAEELLDESRLNNEGYFCPAPIRQKWSEHVSGRRNWQAQMWGVLMFQSWLEQHKALISAKSEDAVILDSQVVRIPSRTTGAQPVQPSTT